MSTPGAAATGSAQASLVTLPLLAAAGFVTGCGMRLLDPLLPLIAHDMGVTVAEVAVLVTSFAIPYGLCQVLLGPLGDRFGKLRVLVLGVLLYGLAMGICAVASSLGQLVVLRATTGALGGAIIPLAMAWIGDNVAYEERQATISRFLTGLVLSQLLAGPVSGTVGQAMGWRGSFLLVGALATLTGVAIMLRLGSGLWRRQTGAQGRFGFSTHRMLLRRPAARRLLVIAFLDGALLFGGAFPFIGSYLIQDFHLEPWQAGLVVAGFGLGSLIYTRMASRLVRRLGEIRLLMLGGALLALALVGLALAPGWIMVVVPQVLLGLFFFMFHGVLQARATEVLPEARATAVSSFSMALFLGQGFGSIAFGTLLAYGGYRPIFVSAAVGILLLSLWCRRGLAPVRTA